MYQNGRPKGRRKMHRGKDRRAFSNSAAHVRPENMISSAPMRLGIRF